MNNWLLDQYEPISLNTREEVEEFTNRSNEFDKWINENPERSMNEIGEWGWKTVRIWMHFKGVYVLPTTELNDYLLDTFFPEDEWSDDRIDKEVIEVCSGYGMLGRMLGIKMTDSMVQAKDKNYKLYYLLAGQPIINYPSGVLNIDANEAVRRFKPHTIIGSYVTWGSKDPNTCLTLGAQQKGPEMMSIYNSVKRIILIGNHSVEAHNTYPINIYPHKEFTDVPGLITRGDPRKAMILVWDKDNYKI